MSEEVDRRTGRRCGVCGGETVETTLLGLEECPVCGGYREVGVDAVHPDE